MESASVTVRLHTDLFRGEAHCYELEYYKPSFEQRVEGKLCWSECLSCVSQRFCLSWCGAVVLRD